MSALHQQHEHYQAVRARLMRPYDVLRQDVHSAKAKAASLEAELRQAHEEISALRKELADAKRFVRPGALEEPHFERRPVEDIINGVLLRFPPLSLDDVRSDNRTREFVACRFEMMWQLHRQRPDLSMVSIGRIVNRDHSCVVRLIKMRNQEAMRAAKEAA